MAQVQRRLMARVGTAQMQAALYFNRKRRRQSQDAIEDLGENLENGTDDTSSFLNME